MKAIVKVETRKEEEMNMHSNNQITRKIKKGYKLLMVLEMKARRILGLGLNGRQWLACFMICTLLLSILPFPAAVYASAPPAAASEFEAVNEELSFWTANWRNLNEKIEVWTTPLRSGNALYDEKSSEKKASEKVKKESAAPAEVKADEPAKTAAATESSSPDVSETETPNAAVPNAEPVKTTEQTAPAAARTSLLLNQLPSSEQGSRFETVNNLGAPAGKTEADSSNEAAVGRITHRPGAANFNFALPLAGLSGRGIDAGVGLTYNSRTWNKSCSQYDSNTNCLQNHFTYDVEESWIAPGFSTGFGYLETRAALINLITDAPNNNWYTIIYPVGLTDPNGTRHEISCKTMVTHLPTGRPYCGVYQTMDGSFLEFTAPAPIKNIDNSTTLNLSQYAAIKFVTTYKDGTKINFSFAFGGGETRRHYLEKIRDRNGNYITVGYKGQTGRIDYINDTLDRKIKFYYENDANGNPDKLVTVTIPGMGVGDEIQTLRFYYETLTLQSGGYASPAVVTAPAAIRVLKFLYIPATGTGYKYEYHPKYGMIKKITRQVGMGASTLDKETTGTLTEGIFAASTEYNYPDGSTPLADVPKYTKRTDDWQGRPPTTPVQETFYEVPETGDIVSKIKVQDGDTDIITQTETYGTGGYVKSKTVTMRYGQINPQTGERLWAKLMSKSEYTWVGTNMTELKETNDAGLTKKTKFEYDQYNNQSRIEEYDYENTAANPPSSTLLRTTEIVYETGAGWISNNLLSLPKSVKTIVGGMTVSKTLYEYDHGGNDASLIAYADIINHDNTHNPLKPTTCTRICPNDPQAIPEGYVIQEDPKDESKEKNGDESENLDRCVTICSQGYDAQSKYRGNVTRVESLMDTSATLTGTDPNAEVSNFDYDIAGNQVSATLSCCQLKITAYAKAYEYAFPVQITKGSSPEQLVTSATYNKNTGLVTQTVDENNQPTDYEYETDTLRLHKTTYANGTYIKSEYGDKLAPGTLPGLLRTTRLLDTNKTVQSYVYFNGRGDAIRSADETPNGWSVSAAAYDKFGRPVRSYNPFYVATPTADIPGDTKYTEVLRYDALNRAEKVRLQDESIVESFTNETWVNYTDADNQTRIGAVSRVKDQADKERRRVVDALGRIIRVDEPTLLPVNDPTTGGLGTKESPNQPTFYSYDGNDNLSKVVQIEGSVRQERRFKYDPLSRLTHEKQVEAVPTLDVHGVHGTADPNKWTKVVKYDNFGRVTEMIDARGVKTKFDIYDGLNRIKKITFTDGTPQILYTYDQPRNDANGSPYSNKGSLTKIETADGASTGRPDTPATAIELNYDLMGRVAQHSQMIGTQTYNLEYNYNLAGQMTSQKYPSGKVVSMSYDAGGRLSGISDQRRTYLSNLQYVSNGGTLSAMTLGNGIQQSFRYNDRLQLDQLMWTKDGNVIQRYNYTFGELNAQSQLKNNGTLSQIESYNGGSVAAPIKQFTQKFEYDAVGRLKSETELRGDNNQQSYKQIFDYDRFGNRYLKAADNPSNQNPLLPTPIEANNIEKETNRLASNTGTVYDDAGNVIIDGKFRDLKYSYDAGGRMYKTSSMDDVNQANSVYDGSGKRVATQINGVWRFFVYDAFGKMVAEYGGAPATDEGGVKYVHQDAQGSTRAITSLSGTVKARMDYAAFGEDISSSVGQRTAPGYNATDSLRQRYAQTERDEASGLDHTWFRKNENRAGRWTSPDPYNGSMNVGDPQSLNRYSYVGNQPTNFIDPSGLLRIQSCERDWWTNSSGNREYSSWRCITIYDDGGGAGGGEGSVENDELFKKCIESANKYYQKTKPTTPTDAEMKAYLQALGRAVEDFQDKVRQKAETSSESIFGIVVTSLVTAALGAWGGAKSGGTGGLLVGGFVGPKGAAAGAVLGALGGAIVGAGIGLYLEGRKKGLDLKHEKEDFDKNVRRIREDNPVARNFADWVERYRGAIYQCAADAMFRNSIRPRRF